jgi:hypothetical protein
MTAQKLHYSLIISSLAVCALMYADAFLSPLKPHNEIVTGRSSYGRRYRYHCVQTNNRTYSATFSMFDNSSVGDTIQIFRSIFTSSAQKVTILNNPNEYSATIGFVKKMGMEFTLIDTVGLIAFPFSYRHIDYLGGRKNITWFLVAATVLLCYFHLTSVIL